MVLFHHLEEAVGSCSAAQVGCSGSPACSGLDRQECAVISAAGLHAGSRRLGGKAVEEPLPTHCCSEEKFRFCSYNADTASNGKLLLIS